MAKQIKRFKTAMKRLLYLILYALLLVGCATKKVTTTEETSMRTQYTDTSAVIAITNHIVDTTWYAGETYTRTIITFEPDTLSSQRPESSVGAVGIIDICGIKIAGHRGNIKSIDQTTIERNAGGRVNISQRDSMSEVRSTHNATSTDRRKQIVKKPTFTIRTWVMAALIVIATLLIVLFKRFSVLSFVSRFANYIRNLI